MKLTIITTNNGWVVCMGAVCNDYNPNSVIAASWSFNNISAALDKLKELLTSAHTKPK